jgi:general secretion pathway protein B
MSYILDALKKSEQERNRGNIPTLHTTSQVVFSHRYLWIGILIGVGALSLVAALAWFINLRLFQPAASPAASAQRDSIAEIGVKQPEAAPRPETKEGEAGSPSTTSAAVEPRPVDGGGELSADAKARVEGLSVNVVSYSDVPARRFVMLNQRIVRESETVGEGIVVKQILPDGAVLSVDGEEILIRPE